MNLLELIGSPRKNGNTEYLADKIVEGVLMADDKVIINKVNLTKMEISPCIACGFCDTNPSCIIFIA